VKLGYSEFSFGYAFTENLVRWSAQAPASAPQFPNLVQEAQLGYDVRIDFPARPLFFQFKLPELMVRETAKEIAEHGLSLTCAFFRMPLMRADLSNQHSHLIDWEQQHPGSVFYASPTLDDVNAFNQAYNQGTVHLSSALFSPNDIGPLPDNRNHVVSYKAGNPFGWFCSKPKEIKLVQFGQLMEKVEKQFSEPRYRRLDEVAAQTMREVIEFSQGRVRLDANAIRFRIRSRIATEADIAASPPSEREVIEEVLTAREVARVSLGVEMVIAQPRIMPE
jgi:hypothetical protein